MAIIDIVILGGGVAGISAALSLVKLKRFNISVYELRASPSTIGGAINLTPNALRYLEYLEVIPNLKGCPLTCINIHSQRTGRKLGEFRFSRSDTGGTGAMRIRRAELLDALLATAQEAGIEVQYGKKAVTIDVGDRASVTFEGGEKICVDILLGCDGIHSFVRSVVDPGRTPIYTGMATAYGLLDEDGTIRGQLPFEASGVWSGSRGSVLASWADLDKSKLFVAAVMETSEAASREGWAVKGADFQAVKADILSRFQNSSVPVLSEMIEGVENFYLYPVYKLPPKGRWSAGCVLLLGDAAHAMPPQGESVGLAIEDTILFARVLDELRDRPVTEILGHYARLRTPRITAAFDEADRRWDNTRDKGLVAGVMMDLMTPLILWWMQEGKFKDFEYDVRSVDLSERLD